MSSPIKSSDHIEEKDRFKSFSSKNSENYLYDLFMQAPGVLTILRGPNFIYEFANEKYLQLIGKDKSIIGKPVIEVLPEVEKQGFIEIMEKVYTTGEAFIGNEVPAKLDRYGDGVLEEVFLDFVYEAIRDENRVINGIIGHGIDVTEKVKNRKLKAESEEKYRYLFNKMDQGFCIVEVILDEEGVPEDYKWLEVNPVFESQTGLKDPIGKTATELVPNLERRWIDIYGKVALTGESLRFIEESEAMGRWFDVNTFRVGGKDSLKVAILFKDITERKHSEEELRKIKDQLSITFHNSTSGMVLIDNKGKLINANKLGAYYQGYDSAEELLAQKNITNARTRFLKKFIVTDEDGQPVDRNKSVTTRALKGEKNAQYVIRYLDKKTEKINWLLTSANPVFDENGNVQLVLISLTDITIQKKAEVILKKNVQRFKTYTEAMPQMAFIADPEGNVTYFNQRWYEYLNENKDSKKWEHVVHPDDLDSTVKRWNKSLKTGESYEIEARLRRHDGEYRWFLGKAEPVKDSQGNIEMWLGTNTDIHERKQAEEELRIQHGLTKAITDNATTGLFIMNESQYCTYMNPAAEKMTGYTLEKIIEMNKPLHDIIHHTRPDGNHYPLEECPIDRALPEKNHTQGEDIFIRPDGTFYTVAFTASPIIRNSETVGTVIEVHDTTEEKKAEKALSDSKNMFHALADNISQLAWMTDESGEIFWYNQRWFDYTGTSLEDMEISGWKNVFHPEHSDRVLKIFNDAVKNGREWEDTFPIKNKNGEYRWFLSRAVPIWDKNGNILHWFGTNTDITELREAEEKLNYQKSLLEAQQEVSPLGVLVVSPQGEMITYNQLFIELWDLPSEIAERRSDLEALKNAQEQLVDADNFIETAHRIYETREKNHEKLVFKNGKILERFGSPIIGEKNIYYGYVWFFLDITEQENLARQKDDFIGIASHELKTPVTSIKAYTQVLQSMFDEAEDQQTAYMLGKMDNQLNKLTYLISDLLDVTKIHQGKLMLNKEKFEFNDLVKEITEEIQRTTTKHELKVDFTDPIPIYADKDRVGQVVTNFLSNAIKYSPKAKKIEIKTETNRDELIFSVTDYGVGLPKEDQLKVFERFYRVGGSGFETYPGLGLGLFISAEIIHRHYGEIWVESEKGKGSTFYFTLPLYKNSKPNNN